MTLGGRRIRIFFEKDALTAWAEDLEGRLLPGVLAYREGWLDFFPDSRGVSVEDDRVRAKKPRRSGLR
jgi:hypothetical protein